MFREDLLRKMQRHLVVPLQLEDPAAPDITEQLVETLLDQVAFCLSVDVYVTISISMCVCISMCWYATLTSHFPLVLQLGAPLSPAPVREAHLLGARLRHAPVPAASPRKYYNYYCVYELYK